MAEGRRDRSGRRRRRRSGGGGGNRASSDSELAGAGAGGGGQQKWFFHEGLDVDQLARYRRRRCVGQPRDHLGPTGTEKEEDQQQQKEEEEAEEKEAATRRGGLVTEYRLAFQSASNDDIFRASQDLLSPIRRKRHVGDSSSEQKNTDDNSVGNSRASGNVPLLTLNNNQDTRRDEEWTRIMEMGTDSGKRPPLIRRPTTLRNEGEFSRSTEYGSYVAHPGHQRTELRRRGTSLRMEGEFESRTENDDKYVEWPACRRPELMRLPSQLHLEGELETRTESHDQYVPFVGARRPDILRQPAHLKLEGDSNWTPEYTDVFREFECVGRQAAKKPEGNLKPGGGFFDKTESKDHLTNPRDKEFELMEELAKDVQDEEERRKKEEEEEEERKRLQREEEMKMLVSKLEDLKSPLEVPEYKDAYKDFPRERPRLMKPEDEIGRADGSKVSNASPSHTRFKTKIDQDPEYKSIYLHDHNRGQVPVYHRPPMSLRSSSRSSSLARAPPADNNNYYRRDSRRFEPPTSEIRSQYVNYGHMPRVETLRMPANLRLEGNIDLDPEYRTAYREPHHHRNSNVRRSGHENNFWLNSDVGDHFGAVNAADEQDAFQVLQTRVHEESVVGKPPPGSRRSSRHPDITLTADRSTAAPLAQPRNNHSPSPSTTYRLQVSHADDEPRGFVRRRRSPVQNLNVHPSSDRSPSPIQTTAERPYSPSFARENSAVMRQQQAFVVLDNREAEEMPRRRRPDRNYDPMESLSGMRGSNGNAVRPRNRSPSNWMPPWYDSSTSTI